MTSQDRTALVSGGTGGIGSAIVSNLAHRGYDVYVCSRSISRARDASARLSVADAPGTIHPLELEVTSQSSVDAALEQVSEAAGSLEVLVNNAGVAHTAPATDMPIADWRGVIDVNLTGPFLLAQRFFELLRSSDSSVVVNMASVAGIRGQSQIAAYSASKGGLIALTKSLAIEWARYGIRVVAVAPGYVRTALNKDVLDNETIREKIIRRTPLRRFAEPEEVADVVEFAIASEFMTGSTIVHDGGWSAQ